MKLFGRSLVVGLSLLLFVTTLSGASAAGSTTRLKIAPVGVDGAYFSLDVAPGETRQLTVELGNLADTQVEARTYAADAYTIVNGGFGARLDGEPTGEVTHWLDYPAATLTLAPGATQQRTFALTVPSDAKPGQYITSLVIQNATPTATSLSGSVGINQINRQVIAVAINVPGPSTPELQIGAASYKTVGERSVVRFDVTNTGNTQLNPTGEFVVTTRDGKEVSRGPITMGSFYAGTKTTVEALLADHLNPGEYIASLALTDAKTGAAASAGNLTVTVPRQPAGANAEAPVGAEVNHAATPADSLSSRSLFLPLLVGSVVIVLLLLVFVRTRRRQPRQPVVQTVTPGPTPPPAPTQTIRQLPIRRRRIDSQ